MGLDDADFEVGKLVIINLSVIILRCYRGDLLAAKSAFNKAKILYDGPSMRISMRITHSLHAYSILTQAPGLFHFKGLMF